MTTQASPVSEWGRGSHATGHWSRTELIVATVAFAFSAFAIATRTIRPSSIVALVASVVLFIVVPGGYIALSVEGVRHALRVVAAPLPLVGRLLAGPIALLIVSVAYVGAAGLPPGQRLTIYGMYLLLPPLLLVVPLTRDDGHRLMSARLIVVVLALWLPIELKVLPPLPLPAPNGVDMRHLLALVNAMYLFLVARPLSRIGYTYRLTVRDATTAVVVFLLYAVVALPIGFASGFITWHPKPDAARLLGGPFIIYLVTGVPEEFLFRGLLQNLLTRWLGPKLGLVIASIVFGFAHLPDPRYVLLAAIAGVAYGVVYQQTERITASAITHALVDGTWVTLLHT